MRCGGPRQGARDKGRRTMPDEERVAIVGMGGIFPSSPSPEQLWANVLAGVDTSREVPPGRWLLHPNEVYDPSPGQPDRVYSRRGCFLDAFTPDLAGLNVRPDLIRELDSVFHVTLHAGRQAFQSAVTHTL